MIKIASILLLVLGVGSFAAAEIPNCTLADARIEAVIKQKVKELDGQEYCQFRRYHTMDDLNHDGEDDFIVLFTVEGMKGGNDHVDFMTVFLSGKQPSTPITVQVGSRGERDPVSIDVQDGVIVLETQVWLKGDPRCCPTGKGQIRFKLNGAHLEPLQ